MIRACLSTAVFCCVEMIIQVKGAQEGTVCLYKNHVTDNEVPCLLQARGSNNSVKQSTRGMQDGTLYTARHPSQCRNNTISCNKTLRHPGYKSKLNTCEATAGGTSTAATGQAEAGGRSRIMVNGL
jgi:hypothetical protein